MLVEGNVAGPIITGTGNTIITGSLAHLVTTLPAHLAPLRDQMTQAFNKSELQNLCFDLGIAYDDLPGDTRTGLAQALISYCHERGRIWSGISMAENMNKLYLTAQLKELRQAYEKGWLSKSAYQTAVAGIKASQKDVPHHNCKEMIQ